MESIQPRGDGGSGGVVAVDVERKDGFGKCPAGKVAWAGNELICGVVTETEASRFPGTNWVISNS